MISNNAVNLKYENFEDFITNFMVHSGGLMSFFCWTHLPNTCKTDWTIILEYKKLTVRKPQFSSSVVAITYAPWIDKFYSLGQYWNFLPILYLSLHEKPYFLFPGTLKRWSFQKTELEYDISCITRKDEISFPWKYNLIL